MHSEKSIDFCQQWNTRHKLTLSLTSTLAFAVQMSAFKVWEWPLTDFYDSTGRLKALRLLAHFYYLFLLPQVPVGFRNICMRNQRGGTAAVSQHTNTHTDKRAHKKGFWQVRQTAEPMITADGHRKSKQLQVPNADAQLAKNNKHKKSLCVNT